MPATKRVIPLDEIAAHDESRMGGKAYNCARLRQAGFPVPDGAAVVFEPQSASEALAELDAWLMRLSADVLLAVRSSATDEDSRGHSFAGIHDTKLNVPPSGVAEAVGACWRSVRTPRALAYRRAAGLPTEGIGAGVLVQVMIDPVVSGVAFTLNPVTGADNELSINSTWGLGESLVGGHVEPDEFLVHKSDGTVVARRVGQKSHRAVAAQGVSRLVQVAEEDRAKLTLTDEQLRELADLLVRLERHFGAPQDVEWCHDGRQFWILQSRPVTARLRARAEIEWTRANVREVLPDLTSPQVLAFVTEVLEKGNRRYYGRLLASEAELGAVVKAFYGRMYFNLSQFRHVCRVTGTPEDFVLRALGHVGGPRPEDEVARRPRLGPLLRAMPDLLRLTWIQFTLPRQIARVISRMRGESAKLDRAARDAGRLSEAELWSQISPWLVEWGEVIHTILSVAGVAMFELRLAQICRPLGISSDRLVQTHVAAGEKSVSTQEAFDLLELARQARREERTRAYFLSRPTSFEHYRDELSGTEYLGQFEAFLAKYGHRGAYETDWAVPRFQEDPTPLLHAIQAHAEGSETPPPEATLARQEAEAAETRESFVRVLRLWQRILILPTVRWLLRRVKRMYLWREEVRSETMRAGLALRRWHLMLAEHFVARGLLDWRDDYFFLTLEEVGGVVAGTLSAEEVRARVARRKAEHAFWKNLEMPLHMRESELPALIRRAGAQLPATEVTLLRGVCVSPGAVEGEVVVLREPTEFDRMKPGAILVTSATDPAWTPMFTLAAGVIVEVGGTLSHASTVAREFGLPALANVRDATRLLKAGDRVMLDATGGLVRVLR